MREPLRDRDRLLHILDAIKVILDRVGNTSFEVLLADKLRYAGVIYYTMIIGEAAYKLSQAFVATHPETDWRVIANMRHHLVHGYYQVNAKDIWDVIQNDLVPLQQQIEQYSLIPIGKSGRRNRQRTICKRLTY